MQNDSSATSPDQPAASPAELALTIYNLLLPQDSDVRQRVMQSAMTLLGEVAVVPSVTKITGAASASNAMVGRDDLNLGPKALRWMQKHNVTPEMLEEVFHLSGGQADIIANSVPGASKREMTVNCYLLCGVRGLLISDSPTLDEAEAIAVCKRLTAYDRNNHTTNRQAVGNKMSGAKPNFVLTGPGESSAAELVRQMTSR